MQYILKCLNCGQIINFNGKIYKFENNPSNRLLLFPLPCESCGARKLGLLSKNGENKPHYSSENPSERICPDCKKPFFCNGLCGHTDRNEACLCVYCWFKNAEDLDLLKEDCCERLRYIEHNPSTRIDLKK